MDLLQRIYDQLGGLRKVIVTLIVFTASVILVMTKVITGDQWVQLNQIVLPAFFATNLLSKFTDKGTKETESE